MLSGHALALGPGLSAARDADSTLEAGQPGRENREDRCASPGCLSREPGRPGHRGSLQTSCRAEKTNPHSVKALPAC